MGAGKLDRRISFERYSLAHDGFQQVEAWAAYGGKVWASKKDVSDGEKFKDNQAAAELTARFEIRSSEFSRTLNPKDRLKYKGETFAIFEIKEIGRDDRLEITAGARIDD